MSDFYPYWTHPRFEQIALKVLNSNALDDPEYDLASAYAAIDSMCDDGRTMVQIEAQADWINENYTIPQIIFVSGEQWDALNELLDAEPVPNPNMSRLFQRPSPF